LYVSGLIDANWIGAFMSPKCLFLVCILALAGCSKPVEPTKGPALRLKASAVDDAKDFYRRGTELLTSNPAEAIELLTKSLSLIPDAPPAVYNRAVAYARLGRDAEAVADIDRLERIEPALGRSLRIEMSLSAAPYTDLAMSEVKSKNYEAAIKKCDSALAYDPKCGDAWAVKGLALKHLNQPEKSMECFNKGAEAEPDNWCVYINRAELHHEQKRLQQALADFTKSIELRPDDPDGFSGRSAVYADLNLPDKAASDAAKAAQLKAKTESKGDSWLQRLCSDRNRADH
jgi:tetratricopeptide (TPR) repeat protein